MQLKVAVFLDGKYEGSTTVNTPCWIGRSKEADLSIQNQTISRKHCELYEDDGQLFLRDSGSLNGTLLMGHFVDGTSAVNLGDEFVIGNLLFRLDPITATSPEERPLKLNESDSEFNALRTGILEPEDLDEDAMRASIQIVGDCFSE